MCLRKRILSLGLASAVVISSVLGGTASVSASQKKADNDIKSAITRDAIKVDESASSNGYLGVTIDDKYQKDYVNTDKDLYGASSVPSAYMNSLAKVNAKYPATRDQGSFGTCWAHAGMAMMEFSMINKGKANKSVNYSELQFAYFTFHSAKDSLGGLTDKTSTSINYLANGFNSFYSQRALASWKGAVNESLVPYSNCNKVLSNGLSSSYAYKKDVAKLTDSTILLPEPKYNRLGEIKQHIMKNGAVEIDYTADLIYGDGNYSVGYVDTSIVNNNGKVISNTADFTKQVTYNGQQVTTYYCPFTADSANMDLYYGGQHHYSSIRPNHAVVAVGWDDNFPASNFRTNGNSGPAGNGAWLIRNSWSTKAGNNINSYFWLSYYDKGLSELAYSFSADKASTYTHNYQYDGGIYEETYAGYRDGYGGVHYAKAAANVFTAKSNEVLKAVSVSTDGIPNESLTIEVYTNLKNKNNPTSGKKVCTQTATPGMGIHAVKLKKSVMLPKGTAFSIVVKSKSGYYVVEKSARTNLFTSMVTASGYSFIKHDGKWMNNKKLGVLGIGDNCIKALTTSVKVAAPSKLKVSAKSKSLKLSWKKASGASGYTIQVATDKNFKKGLKTVTISKGKTTSTTVKQLKSGKKYYVRIRAYKKVSGGKAISSWVKYTKAIKIK